MMRRLLLIVAVVAGCALALCVTHLMDRTAALAAPAPFYYIRLDGLMKAATPGEISSRYVITNLAASPAATQHTFYDELDQQVGVQADSLGAGASSEYDLDDTSLPAGYSGYVIVASDQPITGTVLAADPLPADYRIRLDGLVKSDEAGMSSRYVITNLAASPAATQHEFYDELDHPVWTTTGALGASISMEYDLDDTALPVGYSGYVIVASDQPITGTVLPASPVNTGNTVFLPLVIKPSPPPPPPLGDGFYLVGTQIRPGKWHSTGTGTTCYWARYDAYQNILDNHFGLAGGTVNVRPTDFEVEFYQCGMWEYVEDQPQVLEPTAADPKDDGFYTVGVEIVPGMWDSTGTGTTCYWARLDAYQNILDNHFGLAGGIVTIRETDYEVEFYQCGTWEYLGPILAESPSDSLLRAR